MALTSKKLKQLSIKPFLPKNVTPSLIQKSSSTSWWDLPFEMREIVIDKMDEKTRCRFAQCSKLCEHEAKKSNKYLYGIEVLDLENGILKLLINHQETTYCDYRLEFIDAGKNQTIVAYRCHTDEEWSEETDRGDLKWAKAENGKPEDVRVRYLKEYIEKYKHCIRKFKVDDEHLSVFQVNIKKLKILKTLAVEITSDNSPCLIESEFIDWEQILRVKDLYIPYCDTNFTLYDIINFKGERAEIRSNTLTEVQVNEYLKMRQKGEIHKNVNYIKVHVRQYFNVPFIMKGLDTFNYLDMRTLYPMSANIHKFDFRSNSRTNGVFHVCCSVSSNIEIHWRPTDS